MNCCEGEVVLEGRKGNGPKEIHDAGDFGAFSIDNGHHCLVVTGETHAYYATRDPKQHKLSKWETVPARQCLCLGRTQDSGGEAICH